MRKDEINIDLPEEFFGGASLKKGFSLFRRHQVEFSGRDRSLYSFVIGKKIRNEVRFKLHKNKAFDFNCSCGKTLCEHLCAAVFYLRKEHYLVTDSDKTKGTDESEKRYKQQEKILFAEGLRLESTAELVAYAANSKAAEQITSFLTSIVFCLRNNMFAALTENPRLLFSFLHTRKLKNDEAQYLFFTIKESLRSQRKFETEAWFYLLPFLYRFLTPLMSEELKSFFLARQLKLIFPGNLNVKEVGVQLSTVKIKSKDKKVSAEYFVAEALVLFAQKRYEKAFQILDKGFEDLKKQKAVTLAAYINFILECAKRFHRNDNLKHYFHELVLIEPFISPQIFESIDATFLATERSNFYYEVTTLLAHKPQAQDKVFDILFREKRWLDLITFIRRNKLKFSLLNRVALEMLPEVADEVLKIYPDFLVAALNSAGDGHYRTFIVQEAKKFLIKTHPDYRKKLVEQILSRLGGRQHLSEEFLTLLNPPA